MAQCPISFVPYQGACVRQCPADRFDLLTDNGQPRCALRTDNNRKVNLVSVSSLPTLPGPQLLMSLCVLHTADTGRYDQFKSESDRVDADIAVIVSQLSTQSQIDAAFKRMQDAENVRDQSPEAYQQARVDYYTLLRGPEWLASEKQRIATADVEPEVARYRSLLGSITSRQENQQRTQEVMNAVKDGVLTLKDDFKYTTDTFKEQIENLKNQINIERRGREKSVDESSQDFYKWIDALLNLFIIAGLLYAVFVFWKKYSASTTQPTYAPFAIPAQ